MKAPRAALTAILIATAGCTSAPVRTGAFLLAASGAQLAVQVELPGSNRALQQVSAPAYWSTLRAVLTHPTAGTRTVELPAAAEMQAGSRAVALRFDNVAPGRGFDLFVELLDTRGSGCVVASGRLPALTLGAGETAVSLTLAPMPGGEVAAPRAFSTYVASIPPQGTPGALTNASAFCPMGASECLVATAYGIKRLYFPGETASLLTLDIRWADGQVFNQGVGTMVNAGGGVFYLTEETAPRVLKLVLDGVGGGLITVLAGDTSPGYQDGPGLQARFEAGTSLALATDGSLFAATAHRLRRIAFAPDGAATVSTLAGDGVTGWRDGEAMQSRFRALGHLTTNGADTLYAADVFKIRCFQRDTEGAWQVSTVAGTEENTYIDGPIDAARFTTISGLAWDGEGRLVLSNASRLRRVHLGTSPWVETLAGALQQGWVDGGLQNSRFYGPTDLFVRSDEIWVIDGGSATLIRRVRPAADQVDTIAGQPTLAFGSAYTGAADGPSHFGRLANLSRCLLEDGPGRYLYTASDRIECFEISPNGSAQTRTWLGAEAAGSATGTAVETRLNAPTSLVKLPGGDYLVLDAGNHRLIRVTAVEGVPQRVSVVAGAAGSGFADGPGDVARFLRPARFAVDATGDFWLTDSGNQRIRRIVLDADGQATVTTVAGSGTRGRVDGEAAVAQFNAPLGIAADPAGNVFVLDSGSNTRLRRLTLSATGAWRVDTVAGGAGPAIRHQDGEGDVAGFWQATDLLWHDGHLLIADGGNSRLRAAKMLPSGLASVGTLAGSALDPRLGSWAAYRDGPALQAAFSHLGGLCAAADGSILILDVFNNALRRMY